MNSVSYFYILKPNNCNCPVGYTYDDVSLLCVKKETQAPTVTQSGICLVRSQLAGQYSSSGTKVYTGAYSTTLVGTSVLLNSGQWIETTGNVTGPMNSVAVLVDNNCDGVKDALAAGSMLQYTYQIYSPNGETVCVGIGGDNTFRVDLNGTTLVNCDTTNSAGNLGSPANFNFWHVFPVAVPSGYSLFTFSAIGDGTTNDASGARIYRNIPSQLIDGVSPNVIFRSDSLIGTPIDIASCNTGFYLDTSLGSGNYVCRRTLTSPCS